MERRSPHHVGPLLLCLVMMGGCENRMLPDQPDLPPLRCAPADGTYEISPIDPGESPFGLPPGMWDLSESDGKLTLTIAQGLVLSGPSPVPAGTPYKLTGKDSYSLMNGCTYERDNTLSGCAAQPTTFSQVLSASTMNCTPMCNDKPCKKTWTVTVVPAQGSR